MKKTLLKSALMAMAGIGLMAGSAQANSLALQSVLDGLTVAPVANDSSVDVFNDYISDNLDSYWNQTASGGSVATIIVELAGYAAGNIFGIFDGSKTVDLFGGAAAAGAQTFFSIKDASTNFSVWVNGVDTNTDFSGNTFGFFLKNAEGQTFYSDTSKNTDSFDHMFAYQGTNTDTVKLPGVNAGLWTNNEFILGWEDLYGGGDKDFDDFVVMVESVNPVPEPATMLLFGTGLAGLAGIARRRKK